jgi:hypothetical protein
MNEFVAAGLKMCVSFNCVSQEGCTEMASKFELIGEIEVG